MAADTQLVEFLRARFHDVSCVCLTASSTSSLAWATDGLEAVVNRSTLVSATSPEVQAHIALHDPRHVMMDVEGKGRIVTRYVELAGTSEEAEQALHWALRMLALPFYAHPDYQARWNPTS